MVVVLKHALGATSKLNRRLTGCSVQFPAPVIDCLELKKPPKTGRNRAGQPVVGFEAVPYLFDKFRRILSRSCV